MKIITVRINGVFIHYVRPTEQRYEKRVKDNLIHIGDNVYSDLGLFYIWNTFKKSAIIEAVKK